jgi:hypothetical protein
MPKATATGAVASWRNKGLQMSRGITFITRNRADGPSITAPTSRRC